MRFRTHIVFSLFLGLLIIKFINIKNQILFLFIILFSSILPDIDEKTSTISKKIKWLARPINFLFKHRGFFHSLYIPILISIIFIIFKQYLLALAILIGYLSHLILDSLTKSGIKPLNPIIKLKFKGKTKTGGLFDNILFISLLILDFAMMLFL